MARRGCRIAATALTLAALGVAGFLLYSFQPWRRWQFRVPPEKDPQLVGTWRGRAPDHPGSSVRLVFRSDGEGDGHSRFEWGTDRGVVIGRMSLLDNWTPFRASYSFTPDGRTLQLVFPSRGPLAHRWPHTLTRER